MDESNSLLKSLFSLFEASDLKYCEILPLFSIIYLLLRVSFFFISDYCSVFLTLDLFFVSLEVLSIYEKFFCKTGGLPAIPFEDRSVFNAVPARLIRPSYWSLTTSPILRLLILLLSVFNGELSLIDYLINELYVPLPLFFLLNFLPSS